MGATSVTGVGPGAAQLDKGPDGGNRAKYVSLTAPHVVAAGHVVTVGPGSNWQQLVTFPEVLSGNPHDYVVMTQQDDYANDDGRNEYPPHIEKLDANGDNEENASGGEGGFDKNSGFSGFILHTGDNEERKFMYMVSTVGFLKN